MPVIHPGVTFINPELIQIADHVQIDSGCILVGPLTLMDYVHIGLGCIIFGGGEVIFHPFSGLCPGVVVTSGTDSFGGNFLMGPTVPNELRKVRRYRMEFMPYSAVGAHSTIDPGVSLAEGVAVGSHSHVRESIDTPWGIYYGSPVKLLRPRSKRLLTKANTLPRSAVRPLMSYPEFTP